MSNDMAMRTALSNAEREDGAGASAPAPWEDQLSASNQSKVRVTAFFQNL